MRVRKKPVYVDAVQWTGKNAQELADFFSHQPSAYSIIGGSVHINTLEGLMKGNKGDWIIRGIKGEYYRKKPARKKAIRKKSAPCKPDIFKDTYEIPNV